MTPSPILRVLLFLFALPAFGQSTPEQRYFEWTDMPFPAEEFVQRRAKLHTLIEGKGIALIPARDGVSHGETFRQLNDFMYFSGLELPNSMLVLDGYTGETTLYAPVRDARFESASRPNDFPGRPLFDDANLRERSGISLWRDIASISELFANVEDRRFLINQGNREPVKPLKTDLFDAWPAEVALTYHLQQTYPGISVDNAYEIIAKIRMIKSPREIAALRAAAELTARAIETAAHTIKPGVTERDLEAAFEATCKRGGSQRTPFASIIKSGPNSLWPWRILASHYDRRNRAMQAGELVLFDVGCELNHYVSDVGRSFPVSGRFSDEQRRALDMQRRVSDAIIEAIEPGMTFLDLREVALAHIAEEERPYMQVGDFFGHHLGLDTGDPSLRDAPLEAGMIFTVEPWYYNHETGISVFIEDVILVTKTGAENLTAGLTRTAEGLETLMNR